MDHCLWLKGDGTVWAWGRNSWGQLGSGNGTHLTPAQVSGLTGVVAIAGGGYHSLALKSDGTVWAWGYAAQGQLGDGTGLDRSTPVHVLGLTDVVAISGGFEHNLALKSDGTVWAWGNNTYGQLGDGTSTNNRLAPVAVTGLTGITVISAGGDHSMALKSDGTVWTWGINWYGVLGDGTTTTRAIPGQVSGLSGVVAVAASYYHSLALKGDGTVWGWGENYYGNLGDGTRTDRPSPVPVSALTGVVAISSRFEHSLALKSDGTVWGWGRDDYGQLGDGGSGIGVQRLVPVRASGLTGVVAVAGGQYHGVALTSDGTIWTWGFNGFGALGDGTLTDRPIPARAVGLAGVRFTAIAAGSLHSLALRSDGTVWAWGLNDFGQLGDGTTTNRSAPVAVSGLTNAVAIAAGDDFSLALKNDGTVWAWGTGAEGQLGDGTTTQHRATPAPVSGLGGVAAIAACHESSLALMSDGTVSAWGYPIIGDGSLSQRLTPVPVSGLTGAFAIACGWEVSLALKSDRTVWGWGFNSKGELGDGTTTMRLTPIPVGGLTGVLAIAGGETDSLFLKGDGTVWGLGRDDWSQLGDGVIVGGGMVTRLTPVRASGLTGVVAISAGYIHSLALKSDGTVWKWGSDSFGNNVVANPTPVPVGGLAGMVAIAGGKNHSLALKSDGTIWAWGRNVEGQLGDGSMTDNLTPVLVAGSNGVSSPALRFVPITPCRIADSRRAAGPFGGPPIAGNTSRDFGVPSSACSIPATALAYSLNVAVVPSGPLGFLTMWPAGQTRPVASTLNSLDGRVKSNAAIVPAGTAGAVSVFASNATDVVLDINGYFVDAADPTALAFYPMTPCRVADTRQAGLGLLGRHQWAAGRAGLFRFNPARVIFRRRRWLTP